MRERELEGPAPELQIPEDVEKTYKALQEEIQRIEISPAVRKGESREERFARRQRLRARRGEFEQNSRRPPARGALTNPLTISAMVAATVLLCVISFFGGIALTGILNKPALATDTATKFWSSMETGDYGVAHQYLDPHQDLQQFTQAAYDADITLGPIVGVKLAQQIGGQAKDNSATLLYQISRAGAGTNKAFTMTVSLRFENLPSSGGWLIVDYGNLLSTTPPVAPTATATPKH